MTRKSKDYYQCILCNMWCEHSVICRECEENEMSAQRRKEGFITEQQIWYMNKNWNTISIQEAIKAINEDCVWCIENLSCEEAKKVISILQKLRDEDV